MKWIISCIFAAFIICTGCTKEDKGSIYGIVADFLTAEPMRAAGVSLHKDGNLLLKTVTYDDGHFEFNDLDVGTYELTVEMNGYDAISETVLVESGRTARADIQMKVSGPKLVVNTLTPKKDWFASSNSGTVFYLMRFEGRIKYPNRNDGYYPIDYGFVMGHSLNPTLEDCKSTIHPYGIVDDSSVSTITFKGSTEGVGASNYWNGYHVRAFAINEKGVYYGEDQVCH